MPYNAGSAIQRVTMANAATDVDYTLTAGTAADPNVVGGPVADNAVAAGNPVPIGGDVYSTAPTYTAGDRATMQFTTRGALAVALVSSTGGSIVTTNGASDGQATGSTALIVSPYNMQYNGTTWDRLRKPNAASRIPSSAATTNATSAKASAGDVVSVNGYNSSATVTYLKLYNKASAPTVGTDTPFMTIPLAPTSTFNVNLNSLYFSTGIAYGLTTDAADAGTTAVAAGAILGLNVVYA